MKSLIDLFKVSYGNKLDLNKMKRLPGHRGGINFVGRSSRKHGVSATVAPLEDVEPYPAGLITVALGGNPLASFVQKWPFYTAQNVAVLKPRQKMTFAEKVYACLCISRNRFKYSAFGREANRTLHALEIPDKEEYPSWLTSASRVAEKTASPATPEQIPDIDPTTWKPFRISKLFVLKKGKRLTKANRVPGKTPFIGALDRNNGLVEYIDQPAIHPAGTMTVNYNGIGGVAAAFYQPSDYWCSDDVNALYPLFSMTPAIALFIATIIRREKFRFSFGRKWHVERMEQSEIYLPAKDDGSPDFDFMERYVNSLPFSSQL